MLDFKWLECHLQLALGIWLSRVSGSEYDEFWENLVCLSVFFRISSLFLVELSTEF